MQQNTLIDPVSALIANLLVASIGLCALVLWWFGPDAYYVIVQEDEVLEWSTFWVFIGAACVYLHAASRPGFSLTTGWFPIGLALFCLFVALEEISWGQRIFGYRPPEYFLQFNYQQEFNLHNVIETRLRKLGLIAVIYGYGVGLPLLNLIPSARRLFGRVGILSSSPALIPAFLVTGAAQQIYPIKFAGEWVEMMLGTCFLLVALVKVHHHAESRLPLSLRVRMTGALLIVLAAGLATATATNYRRSADPDNDRAARFELEALYEDFTSSKTRLRRCGFHRRIFTFAEKTGQLHLYEGAFAQLIAQNLPEQRAAFFLDPWNYAYWIRDNCAADGRPRTTYLYSFGPNRRRDSTRWQIRGDDIAVVLRGSVDDFRD